MATHFSTVDWAKGANIYEVNIRQYTQEGTFAAFAQHLPRLHNMGVSILWFMPITPISKEGRLGSLGSYYACSSYTKINPEFGTLTDFKAMIELAHGLGMKVIIDWVANHTGCDHEWTTQHFDYYVRDAQGKLTERNGWKDVIDLNYNSITMRQALIDAMKYWITECDIDGFRCDMAHLVPLDFWKDARTQCDAVKHLFWLAECEVTEYHDVYDVSYAWQWMHETEKYTKGKSSLNDVRNVLHGYSQYPDGAAKMFFTANHDENSWNGTEYEKYGQAAKAWAVLTCTWQRGFPLIYSGQESPNVKRLQFFDKDAILWNEPCQLHNFYATLLALHKTDAVAVGELFILPTEHPHLMAFLRRSNNQVVLVVLNFSASERIKITVTHPWLQGTFKSVFSQLPCEFRNNEVFELDTYGYLVYEKC